MPAPHTADQAPTPTERLKTGLLRHPRVYELSRRPYALSRYWMRRPHEPAYAGFGCFPDRAGLFLDVGANAGMSALSFRIYRDDPVVSLEPNPFHERDLAFLKRFVLSRFDYRIFGAAEHSGEATLYVPTYHGVPLTAEASLTRDQVVHSRSLRSRLRARMDGPAFQLVARRIVVVAIDDLALAPAFVKLDVQGAEYGVLLGMQRTLARMRPVLLVETPGADVRALLADAGYEARVYDPATRRLVPESAGRDVNTFFVPRDT